MSALTFTKRFLRSLQHLSSLLCWLLSSTVFLLMSELLNKYSSNGGSDISLLSFHKMTGSIKIFQFVQKCNQTFGIYSNQKCDSFNSTKIVILISFALFMLTTAAFLLFKAKSMFEYGFVFFLLATVTNATAIYLIFICTSRNASKFIENCERFIGKSE